MEKESKSALVGFLHLIHDRRIQVYLMNRWDTLDQKSLVLGTSLVVQWLRIHLPMQETRVQALVREDPTCHGATKPVRHNY